MTPSLLRSVRRACEHIAILTCTVRHAAAGPDCSNEITVVNGNDLGAGSLRQAIADVCSGGDDLFRP